MTPEEYIKKSDALEIVKRTCGDYATAWSKIRQLLAADVAPVVRCKDCIRGFTKFIKNEKVIECQLFNYDDPRQFKDLMDYCSHGVKNEGENKNENS